MTIRKIVFDVTTDNEKAALAFDMRATMLDFVRNRIAETISRAEDAEIDKATAIRRFSMTYAGAAKVFRLVRAVPGALVNWAAYAEMNRGREDFPVPNSGTVATFNSDAVTALPGGLLMIRLGGVMFIGACEGGKPDDLFETRVHKDVQGGKYIATFVCGRIDGDNRIGMPVPVEPEGVDA